MLAVTATNLSSESAMELLATRFFDSQVIAQTNSLTFFREDTGDRTSLLIHSAASDNILLEFNLG